MVLVKEKLKDSSRSTQPNHELRSRGHTWLVSQPNQQTTTRERKEASVWLPFYGWLRPTEPFHIDLIFKLSTGHLIDYNIHPNSKVGSQAGVEIQEKITSMFFYRKRRRTVGNKRLETKLYMLAFHWEEQELKMIVRNWGFMNSRVFWSLHINAPSPPSAQSMDLCCLSSRKLPLISC